MAPKRKVKGVPLEGRSLTPSQRKQAEEAAKNGHAGAKALLLTDKYAHLGFSVPSPLQMTDAHPVVTQNVTARDKKGNPTEWTNSTKENRKGKAKTGLDQFFVHPETGKVTGEIHDLEGLHAHPQFQHMVRAHMDQMKKNVDAGLYDKAVGFYPASNAKLHATGKAFNDKLVERGEKPYFPEQPELAGVLLSTAYSKGNSEANRHAMVKKVIETGEMPDWNGADKDVARAREGNIHPLDVWNAKLRDFAGAQLHPETWSGEHDGKKIGEGYTVDRHVNNTSTGRFFGDMISPGLSGPVGSMANRRYRVQQEALKVAHEKFAPELSRPAAQSLGWAGHLSAQQYQAPEGA